MPQDTREAFNKDGVAMTSVQGKEPEPEAPKPTGELPEAD